MTLPRAAVVLGFATACLLAHAGAAVGTTGSGVPRLSVPGDLRVVSYYPADAGWTLMWERWRPERLAADLERLRGLNANTVRIVVPAHEFGYPEPLPERIRQLRAFVEIAARRGLYVQLTLFDWWYEYRQVEASKRWARAVLEPYVGDPRIAFVELKNELDATDPEAVAWVREVLPWLRTLLRGRTPVTVSVGGTTPVADLRALVRRLPAGARPDFFDVHYLSGEAERALGVFRALRRLAGPTPLWIGELGYPSSTAHTGFPGVPLTRSAQEAAQAHYYRLCFAAVARVGLPPPGIWVLDDFAPGAIPQPADVTREEEYRFGLFRANGRAKPAAAVVRQLYGGRPATGFNGGFESAVRAEDGEVIPAVWGSTGALRLVRDARRARSGVASARIVGPPRSDGTFLATPVLPRRTGRIEASAWVRGSGTTVRLTLAWFDASGRELRRRWTSIVAADRWGRAAVIRRPPVGAVFARVELYARDVSAPVWLDDVAVVSLP